MGYHHGRAPTPAGIAQGARHDCLCSREGLGRPTGHPVALQACQATGTRDVGQREDNRSPVRCAPGYPERTDRVRDAAAQRSLDGPRRTRIVTNIGAIQPIAADLRLCCHERPKLDCAFPSLRVGIRVGPGTDRYGLRHDWRHHAQALGCWCLTALHRTFLSGCRHRRAIGYPRC